MIGELLSVKGAGWTTLGLMLLIFGFAPGMVLALVVRLFAADDPRRHELHAELYSIPRWERPLWVVEQFDLALREGAAPRLTWWWGRVLWHRAKIESGVAMHEKFPDSFWIPSDEDKAELRPGDHVKLMWSVKRMPGERMWVTIRHRDGDNLVGTLNNWSMFVFLHPDETVKFHVDDVIDFQGEDEDYDATTDGPPSFSYYHEGCN